MEHQNWDTIYVKTNKFIEQQKKKENINKEKKNNFNENFSKENKINKKIENGEMKHEKMDVSFGKNLQKLRLSKNLTQKDLANKLNIPVKTINDIESGKAKHNGQLMNKINRYFK